MALEAKIKEIIDKLLEHSIIKIGSYYFPQITYSSKNNPLSIF